MKRTSISLALALLVLLSAAPASAETIYDQGRRIYNTYIKPASNPYKALASLSDSQEKAVRAYLRRDHVDKVNYAPTITYRLRTAQTGATITQTVERCYDQEFLVRGEGYLGNALYTFTQHAYWCWQDGKITSSRFPRTGTVHALFWEYKGVMETDDWGGPGYTRTGRYSQAKFSLCVVGFDIGCIQNDTPWISQEMFTTTTGIESGGL